jgi:LmbE family N-acetylglucosaminyl deacetylase
MKLHNETAEIFVPDGSDESAALARITHLGVGAHPDDLEIMGYHGITSCYGRTDRWFGGVTCTDGAGSSRSGIYAHLSDAEMAAVRRAEQRKAAIVGEYAAIAQLDYPSSVVKDPENTSLRDDLFQLLQAARPEVVYTHNPVDKHATHVAVLVPLLEAIREMPAAERPGRVYGCEVWRDLDWLPDDDKIGLDISQRPNLAAALLGLFDSQVSGGKRYDLATVGRWQANATYFESHEVDRAEWRAYAMDLTPLTADDAPDLVDYVLGLVDKFREDVRATLSSRIGRT